MARNTPTPTARAASRPLPRSKLVNKTGPDRGCIRLRACFYESPLRKRVAQRGLSDASPMSMRSRDHGRPRLRPCLRAAFNSAFGALTTRSVSPLQRRTQNAPTVHQFMLSSTGNAFARVEMKNSFSVMFHLRAKRKQVCTQHTPRSAHFPREFRCAFPGNTP